MAMFIKGQKFTIEHRQKISNALSKRKITEETRRKLQLAQRTRVRKPFSEEAKKKISNALLGNKNSTGHFHSNETKTKIRSSMNKYLSTHSGKFRDTKIEKIVEKQLRELKLEYRKQHLLLQNKYSVDFFLPSTNTIIECDGCYYHSCEECGKTRFLNRREADSKRETDLSKNGYNVIRIWEHSIVKKDFNLSKYF